MTQIKPLKYVIYDNTFDRREWPYSDGLQNENGGVVFFFKRYEHTL